MKTLANDPDAAEIGRRLEVVTENQAGLWGRMSAAQMVCHVRESYLAVLEGWTLTPGGKAPLPGAVMKWMALRAPMRWPQGVPTSLELQVGQPGTVPVSFAQDRAEAMAAMERFRANVRDSLHPIFGSMKRSDWLRWGYLHADHHLRQFGR